MPEQDDVSAAPWVGLSLMPEESFRLAAAPLFTAGLIDVVEWSFDVGWASPMPRWLLGLLAAYEEAGRLLGHGVHFSPLSAHFDERQERWLDAFEREVRTRSYFHVSEHYGFMTAPPFKRGAPLPVPRCSAALRVGRARLAQLRERLSCPVGLENLALAWSRDEALAHGAFLDLLLEDARDFLVLDVHNLYCQTVNFEIRADHLLASLPLSRVREIHISGGSFQRAWPHPSSPRVRCDTHDESVPEPVFELLSEALSLCTNVRAIIFERLGNTLRTPDDCAAFQRDFTRIRTLVQQRSATPSRTDEFPPRASESSLPHAGATEQELANYQAALLTLLLHAHDEDEVRAQFACQPAFAPFRENLATTDGRALGIGSRIVKKWLRS